MAGVEERLDGTIAHRALVRYDAYNEMSGHQSHLDRAARRDGSGVVLSSIHHRDQARLYAKQVRDGEGELELSPEEAEAVRLALDGAATGRPPERPSAMRVGYLGPEGTFSAGGAAGRGRRAEALEPVAAADASTTPSWPCASGAVERALVPIENSLEGSVNATLDALAVRDRRRARSSARSCSRSATA